MTRNRCRHLLAVAIAALVTTTPIRGDGSSEAEIDWWDVPYPKPFDGALAASDLDFVRVDGNRG